MLGVVYRILSFMREMDRGMAMMRGEVGPGAYDRQRRRRLRRNRRCEGRAAWSLRHRNRRHRNRPRRDPQHDSW